MEDISHAIIKEKRFGFEEVAYLLLSGRLPDKEELASFCELINDNMALEQKTKMNIIELEGNNIMNILARSVLEMYRFDPDADDTSRDNLMRQSIDLISKFPTIIAYAYNMLFIQHTSKVGVNLINICPVLDVLLQMMEHISNLF